MTCRYCGGETEKHLGSSEHGNVIEYQLCRNCLIAIKPHTQDYNSFTKETLGKVGHLDLDNIANIYSHIGARIKELKPSGTLLDYGCACGGVLKLMQGLGYDVEGFDICPVSIEVCKENGFKCSTIIPKEKFDVIWCSETIEHLPEPLDFIKYAQEHINPKGIVYIQTQQPALNGEKYFYAYQGAHTVLLTPTFLETQMSKHGFKVVDGGQNELGCYWRFFEA